MKALILSVICLATVAAMGEKPVPDPPKQDPLGGDYGKTPGGGSSGTPYNPYYNPWWYNPYWYPYSYWGGYFPYHPGYYNHGAPRYYQPTVPVVPHAPVPYGPKLVYHGQFKGTCENSPDGLYYVDDRSFAFCSNHHKTIQPCADGAANPPISQFKYGHTYGFYDFCSVNLVAQGYPGYGSEGYLDVEYVPEKEKYPTEGYGPDGYGGFKQEFVKEERVYKDIGY